MKYHVQASGIFLIMHSKEDLMQFEKHVMLMVTREEAGR
jgi:hypothetical protein